MTRLTTGDIIATKLSQYGVDTIFGIPGAHTYDLSDAIARNDDLRFIHTRHEQGAAYMAYGYARSSGRAGVFTVVPGPGLLNAGAALCTAYGANTPVMCITGNIMSHMIGQGRGQLHELPDQLALMRGLTKWADRITHPANASEIMDRAFHEMFAGRPRPVGIEAPWDVFGQETEHAVSPRAPDPVALTPDSTEIEAAVKAISTAKNPLIMVGGGALDASAEVQALARRLQAPVTAHRSGKGIMPEDDPLSLLPPGAWKYWQDCDLLIGIGSRLELQHMRWKWLPPGLKTIRIDTDPIEFVRLPAACCVLSDAALGVQAMLDELPSQTRADRDLGPLRSSVAADVAAIQPQVDYLSVIRSVLPRDGFFVEEVSQVGFTARMAFPVYAPRTYMTCGYQDNLGFGFNTALGTKVANPDKAVVSVSGDGGFMFGVQELATAVQHGINVVSIVFNNGSYGNVRRDQKNRYANRLIGSALENPDFTALAESFGAWARRVSDPEALGLALKDALDANRPAVIEVMLERDSDTSPWPLIHPTI
ncbi:thiamine pyrophosphate-dependent enzyme [Yoonia sp. R2331]|uniref:thiamine pyrophosphate-dependent enzyme n=1 Tax=Yoonia sp. R2331 TaxID=3237238 RepID=UPI0034E4D32C